VRQLDNLALAAVMIFFSVAVFVNGLACRCRSGPPRKSRMSRLTHQGPARRRA
jgi:hypothetical protein